MVTLYGFGPLEGVQDASPFVLKAHMLLRMAKVDYQNNYAGYNKAPKGKLPYIDDGGEIIADSTFIRLHLEKTRKLDFDSHLNPAEKATAWAFEKMCENHLYWGLVEARWLQDENFHRGPARFFKDVPMPMRLLVHRIVRKKVRAQAHAAGMVRHKRDEIELLAKRDLQALSDFLGEKKYFMGGKLSSVDATIYAFVASALCETFQTPIRAAAEGRANLLAYRKRIEQEFFTKAGH